MLDRGNGTKWGVFSIFIIFFYIAAIPFELDSANSGAAVPLREKIKLGELKRSQGDFEQAIEFFIEALALAREENNGNVELECLMRLGVLNWNISQYDESQRCYSKALVKARQLNFKTKQEEAQAALDIYKLYSDGYDFYSAGYYKKSIDYLNRALALSKKYRSEEHKLKCLQKISTNYLEMDCFTELFSFNKEALDIARMLKHKKIESLCLINLGIYYWKMDNLLLALQCYEESLLIARSLADIKTEAYCLNNLGIIYKELGNYEKALDYIIRSQKIDKQLNDEKNIAKDFNNIGTIFQEKEKYYNNREDGVKALDYYNESLVLARKIGDKKTEINVLNNLGWLYAGTEEFSIALKYFLSALNKAAKMSDDTSKSMIYSNLGLMYLNIKNYEESEKSFFMAINLALKLKSGRILWEAYFGLGQCCEKKKDYSAALEYYQKSIEIIDSIRSHLYIDYEKAGFVRDKHRVYECYIDALYSLYAEDMNRVYKKSIFLAVEKAKARAFLENLWEEKVNIQGNWSPALKNQEEQISKIISTNIFALSRLSVPKSESKKLWESIKDAEDEYTRFLSKVRLESPEVAGLVFAKPCGSEEVQRLLLDEKSALIEYFLGDKRSYLFFLTNTQLELYLLPPRQVIENSLNGYLKSLNPLSRDKFIGDVAAKRLLKELLFPLKARVGKSIDRLIIIPDGILYYLPFEALQLDVEQRYLVEEFAVSYAPSASSLLYLSKADADTNSQFGFLGIGDPIYFPMIESKGVNEITSSMILRDLYLDEGFNLSPLPYSKKEILKIARYFPKDKSRIYLGEEANEEVVKKSPVRDFQVIHFACHGFLDEKVPYRSALVLSAEANSQEDGFLQVREIYNLRMRANLVVLSACQTGRGTLEHNEGILGLPRIFFYSGAKSVISTLWKINDQSTSIFMDDFYKYLSRGNDKAEALRLAKVHMLKSRYAHPYYWAAFVLNGDSRSRLNFN